MKNIFLLLSIIMLFACYPASCNSIDSPPTYWVIETNIHTKDYSLIRFYQGDQVIYEERIEGIYLDPNKPSVKHMLNRSLRMFTQNRLVALQLKGYSQFIANALYKKREDY